MSGSVSITLITSGKSGVLASLILKAGKLGLKYRKNISNKLTNSLCMEFYFEGTLDYSESELVNIFKNHHQVEKIEKISLETDNAADTNELNEKNKLRIDLPLSNFSEKLNSYDIITPVSLKIAEEKLTEHLGLVAPLLVEAASKKTKHIGDLFLLLSEELDSDERHTFLSSVQGINL